MKNKINAFTNKIVLITGGTGSIGSEIAKQLAAQKVKEIRIYSRGEFKHFLLQQELSNAKNVKYIIGDVRDKFRLEEAMNGCHFVFHTAAMKHISFCNNNPGEAIKTNILGSQNVIAAAIKNKVSKVIGISNDKEVNPNTFMGKTKLVMESLFTSQTSGQTIFSIVRLGNIMHSRGSVVPIWMDQIQRGIDITITDKRMKRYLMEVDDAARLIINACLMSLGKEIFVIKMEERNIYDLASEIIDKYGQGKKVGIKLVGIRYAEKLREELLTEEEKSRSIETKNFYIILPNNKLLAERKEGIYE